MESTSATFALATEKIAGRKIACWAVIGRKIGVDFFRVNAYRKAAEYLDNLKDDIQPPYLVPRIIGEKNAKKIEEYIKKGAIKEYEELKEENEMLKNENTILKGGK